MKLDRTFKYLLSIFIISALFYGGLFAAPAQTADYVAGKAPKIGGGYAVTGQIPQVDYTTEIYDATNGLPTSDANFILGSKSGYIWICGYSGVIRYDGTTFERLPTLSGLTSGRGLFEDSKKRIWVATNDNGVVVLENEQTRHYTYQDGLPSSSIRIFAEDNDENIFIGTTAGVCYVDPFGRLYRISDERINDERVLKLDSDYNGVIYGQTKSGLIFSIENCRISKVYSSKELGMNTITTIMTDPLRSGKVYIGTEGSELYYGDFGKPAELMRKIDVAPLKNIHWLSYDCGRIWISSTTMLGWLDQYYNFYPVKNLPMNSSIEMSTADYQGNIWMASATQGVMKIVTNNFVNLSKIAALPKDVTNTTCFHNDLLYIGTDRGLRILNKKYESLHNELTRAIGNARVRTIIEDKNNNLWIGTYTNNTGLICQSPDGKITSFTEENGLINNHVRCLNLTKDGRILCGTNGGLVILKDGKITKTYGSSYGIKNTEFLTVCEGDNNNIFCGSDGDGIYIISDTGVKRLGRDEGLTSDVVMRIKKDLKRELYWVVTSNSIEYIKNGQIHNVKSFPYNNNYDLYQNDKDEMWILSSYGIYTEKTDELIMDSVTDYRHYTIANGLPFSITSNSYSSLAENGNLYISGREGVIRVNINHYFDGNSQVKVAVNSIFCDDQKIFHNIDDSYTLPASNGRIKIVPAVLDYTMANPYIRVFLEGSNDYGQTIKRNQLKSLEYTRLSYGNYKLHIQVLDNNRRDILVDQIFHIEKRPLLSELLFFRIILISFLILTVGFIVWRFMKSTIIRRQYNEIIQAKDEAERANTAKVRFLSNMSQEILTPINTIMGMNEMILREEAREVPKSYFLSIMNYAFDIRSASESLLGLINDLLEMTKIETGKIQLVQSEYDVKELLHSVISLIRVKTTQKQLKFNINIDEMLPARLYGDVGKIKHVLIKLLSNAVKFTDEGSIQLTVSMETRNDNICGLCFSIKDTGIGIKQEEVENLFNPYLDTDDENARSQHIKTGLGLDISRKFAELMGGVLVCQSVYGEGSEFIFTLTQKIEDATPIGIFTELEKETTKGPYIPQFIAPDADVLVIAQNPMIIHVMRELLKATKVFVTTATSCEDSLDKIRSNPFNVVFLDQMVSGMDGEDAIQKIREINPDIPVYALTENAESGEEYYKSIGFNGCISIPVDNGLLERIIMRHLPSSMMAHPSMEDYVEDLKEIPPQLKWIYDVKEISVDEGIKFSGGIGTYIFSLTLFLDTIDDNVKQIEAAYKKGDFKLLAVKMKIVKTSAKFIGATDFFNLTSKVEAACQNDDTIFVSSNIDRLISEYKAFKERLAALKGE